MTKNQQNLIRFIAHYRAKYGSSPTLQEMAKGISVSDHKSVSGIITALLKKGFLEKGNQKTRSILLTDKAFELLGTPLFRRQSLEGFNDYFYLQNPSASSSVFTSPTPDYVGHGKQSIKTNGTSLANDLRTVVGNTATSIATKIYQNQEIGILFSWGLLFGALTWANIAMIGNGTNALIWTGIEVVIVKFLSKKIIL